MRKISIKELNLLQEAYYKKLNFMDYLKMVGGHALLFAFSVQLVFWFIPATIFALMVGGLFGLVKLLPGEVKKNYYLRSYVMRNRMINNFTQLLINKNLTLLDVIEKVIPRLEGELYYDMAVLLATLNSADEKTGRKAFDHLRDKYKDDIVFGQYLDQMETVFVEGTRNIDTFKELKTQHNKIIKSLGEFKRDKLTHYKNFRFVMLLIMVLISVFVVSQGIDTYVNSFAHQPVGIISISLYLLLVYKIYVKVQNYYKDYSITTL